ncbi:hypothetical protein Taro_048002 [Colocasia esculenta]|uniref:Uncharacterized protein n=1 Tax=Colocasia esculenta TaxID=4460 RepID=A0A843X746_COLES|nr:hypothetical protein [Colocasia esculenta]
MSLFRYLTAIYVYSDWEVDYGSELHASIVYAALTVDKERSDKLVILPFLLQLQPDKVKRHMSISDGKLLAHFEAVEARLLRASFSSFVDLVTLATKTIEEFETGKTSSIIKVIGFEGINESTVHLLCHHGARVVIVEIQNDKGEALCRKLGRPTVAIFFHCDVSNKFNVCKVVDVTITAYGKLDVAFSNPRSWVDNVLNTGG